MTPVSSRFARTPRISGLTGSSSCTHGFTRACGKRLADVAAPRQANIDRFDRVQGINGESRNCFSFFEARSVNAEQARELVSGILVRERERLSATFVRDLNRNVDNRIACLKGIQPGTYSTQTAASGEVAALVSGRVNFANHPDLVRVWYLFLRRAPLSAEDQNGDRSGAGIW